MQQRSEKSAGPVFLSGSVMRHVLVMTSTGAIGLVSIFLAELIDVLFLSMLGDTEIVAAVGYSGPIVFLTVAAAIGLSIATVSLVAPAIGARDIAAHSWPRPQLSVRRPRYRPCPAHAGASMGARR